jgi:hypothetical protein
VPCRRTQIRRNLVELFLAVTLNQLTVFKIDHPSPFKVATKADKALIEHCKRR